MSDRAQFIIIENGQATNYCSKWGSAEFPFSLLDGPTVFLDYVRGRFGNVTETHKYFFGFANSEAVFDISNRLVLLWFYEHGIYLDYILELIQHIWSEWNVRFAFGGECELAEYIGWPAKHDHPIVLDQADPPPTPKEAAAYFVTRAFDIFWTDPPKMRFSESTRAVLIEYARSLDPDVELPEARRGETWCF
jgi:hypothetical protein